MFVRNFANMMMPMCGMMRTALFVVLRNKA